MLQQKKYIKCLTVKLEDSQPGWKALPLNIGYVVFAVLCKMSQFIYPAHSTQASAIVCQCLLVLCAPLRVLLAHILIHSTHSSAIVCVLLHTSLSCVYQCSYLFLRTTSTIHKYVSTSHRIVHIFTHHRLNANTYTSTVTQYTTRRLPTGTAFISHATPTRVAVLS
jgi:hypothetical protein